MVTVIALWDCQTSVVVERMKRIEFWIEQRTEDSVYIVAIATSLCYCFGFYLVFLITICAIRIREKRTEGHSSQLQETSDEGIRQDNITKVETCF